MTSQILLKETLAHPSQCGSYLAPCAPTQPPSPLHGLPWSIDRRTETDASALPNTPHLFLRLFGSRERLRSYRAFSAYPVTFYSNYNKQHLHREQVVDYFTQGIHIWHKPLAIWYGVGLFLKLILMKKLIVSPKTGASYIMCF